MQTLTLDPETATALEIFQLRCWARALLVREGSLRVHEAWDELQHHAEDAGILDAIGQDAVQAIMAGELQFSIAGELKFSKSKTPQTTVEAIMHAVREHGLDALYERDTLERLKRCDEAARSQIDERLAALFPEEAVA